jgi:hypothetical protein
MEVLQTAKSTRNLISRLFMECFVRWDASCIMLIICFIGYGLYIYIYIYIYKNVDLKVATFYSQNEAVPDWMVQKYLEITFLIYEFIHTSGYHVSKYQILLAGAECMEDCK